MIPEDLTADTFHMAEQAPPPDANTFHGPMDGADSSTANPQNVDERRSQATRLVELAVFHDAAGETYARYKVGDHQEVACLSSKAFKNWLCGRYFTVHGDAANTNAVSDALNTLNAHAQFGGDEREVHLRVAELGDTTYLDLCDKEWRVVEIDPDGWRVRKDSPVMFQRAKGMLSIPEPVAGGKLSELRNFINIVALDWILLTGWLVAALRARGPYPILHVEGEQGSAKSTLCRMVKMLIDPNQADLRSEPRNEHDLVIAASNSWVICLDNLSRVSPSISDAMCRIATGGGFCTRKLYQDNEEMIFDSQRPQIINGITGLGSRSDLIDRLLMLNLPAIPPERRRSEADIFRDFEKRRPYILGDLLTAVSSAKRRLPETRVDPLPRMADFALFATAAEEALGLANGEFMEAYNANRRIGNDAAMDASPLGRAIVDFAEKHGTWTGSATELLKSLNGFVDAAVSREAAWPKSAQSLGDKLNRVQPNLRLLGVDVVRNRVGPNRDRIITLTRLDENAASNH